MAFDVESLPGCDEWEWLAEMFDMGLTQMEPLSSIREAQTQGGPANLLAG